jgi:peptidoglycan hydrolase-like protein with peptidoglycan-binding domain
MYATRPDHLQEAPAALAPYSERRPASRLRIPAFMSEAPALFAGAILSLSVMGAIFVNAVWFQPVVHPSPLFAPRAALEQATVPALTTAPVTVPTPKPQQVTKVEPAKQPAIDSGAAREILREVQSALSVRGYYEGKLDGIYGSRSEKAITTFQRDHGIDANGQASVKLLTKILLSGSAKPAEVPVPAPVEVRMVKTKPVPLQQETALAPPHPDGLIAQIQQGLRAFGYDQLTVDGQMGQQTSTAIQRFQLYFGMEITGEPSEAVLDKLREVGAYQQG